MFAELMRTGRDERMAAYADPSWRARAVDDLAAAMALPVRWNTFSITETESHPELVGRKVTEVAEEWGVHPIDVLLTVAVDDKLETRVQATIANDDTDGVAYLLQQDSVTLGLSDAGAHVGQLCDAPQATDLLGNWVRDRGVLSVEAAVRKLSGLQADIFGLGDRGYLREGLAADVAVFDPATVAPGPLRRVARLPGRRRPPDGRRAHGREPRRRERHADPGRRPPALAGHRAPPRPGRQPQLAIATTTPRTRSSWASPSGGGTSPRLRRRRRRSGR